MRKRFRASYFPVVGLALFCTLLFTMPVSADENPYEPTPYDAINSILEKHEKDSNRVSLEIVGKSSLGHDIYSVIISDPKANGKYGKYQALRKKMFNNPGDAQEWANKHSDFKVPILIHGSIHGNEYPGTDAVLELIERFAYEDDEETKSILENNILIFNVVVNPDGRILGTRANGEGFDLNRDMITVSQPETEVMINMITEWNPMVMLDLHGFVRRSNDYPGLIEPCTIPHNPNYEYDLFLKWALGQAEAMEEEIVANKDNYESDLYRNMKGTHIPIRDAAEGWDDYPPIFVPMYAMYHGAYAYTLETPTNNNDGVAWNVNAVMGALKYATENKTEMIMDQIEIFKRGIQFDHPYHEEGFFPENYILPVDKTDATVTQRTVDYLIKHDIEVSKANKTFSVDGNQYEAGTYIVEMDQAKAGLANTLLWEGEDISQLVNSMYDISAWSLPTLWGFDAIATNSSISVPLKKVNNDKLHGELVGKGPFEIPNSSIAAIKLVNKLLQDNVPVFRADNGNYYLEKDHANVLRHAAKESGLSINSSEIPDHAELIQDVKVALLTGNQHGMRTALKDLGFQVTEVTAQEITNNGLSEYDVVVSNGNGNSNNASFKQNIEQFIADGGKYIAVGQSASSIAVQLGLAEADIHSGGRNSNGIVRVDFNENSITNGYDESDSGFVYNPVWYTNVAEKRVLASYANENLFTAGFWKNPQVAQGQPVIIKGNDDAVTLIGLEVAFRAHPENLYRILSNAIFE